MQKSCSFRTEASSSTTLPFSTKTVLLTGIVPFESAGLAVLGELSSEPVAASEELNGEGLVTVDGSADVESASGVVRSVRGIICVGAGKPGPGTGAAADGEESAVSSSFNADAAGGKKPVPSPELVRFDEVTGFDFWLAGLAFGVVPFATGAVAVSVLSSSNGAASVGNGEVKSSKSGSTVVVLTLIFGGDFVVRPRFDAKVVFSSSFSSSSGPASTSGGTVAPLSNLITG